MGTGDADPTEAGSGDAGNKRFLNEDYAPLGPHQAVNDDHPRMPQQSQIRTVVIAVVATLAVVVVGWFGWQKYSEHKDAEKKEQLSSWVQTSIQHKMDEDSKFSSYGIRVNSVSLIKVSDNKYEGMVQVTTSRSSETHQVPIDVTADGDQMMWQAEPGAFLFLAQEALQN